MKKISALILILVLAFTACSKGDAVEGITTVLDDAMPSITVIYSVSGPGDNGYNDMMTEGIMPFCDSQNIALHTLRPVNTIEAQMMLEQWLKDTKGREQRSLLVMAGAEYEDMVAAIPPLDDKRSLLLLESVSENMPQGVSTANIERKSVFYLAGAMSARNDTYIIAAMRGDKILDASIKAFKDGYEKHAEQCGIEGVSYISDEDELLELFPEWSYSKPDIAYEMSRRIAAERKKLAEQTSTILDSRFILLPLAGASNLGTYMLAMEEDINGRSPMAVIGMDRDFGDQMGLSPFSVVLRVNKMMSDCLSLWARGENLPAHRTYTMQEGYADVVVNPSFDTYTCFALEEDRSEWYVDDETGETVYGTKYIDKDYWEKKYKELKNEALEYGGK